MERLTSQSPGGNGPADAVEMLVWEECPSHEEAMALLREALREIGREDVAVRVRQVHTDAEAVAERFVGSPTVRVGGADLLPASEDEDYGLTCRIYRLRDGRASPTPDPADLREALAARLA
jgi:hypothetical protein